MEELLEAAQWMLFDFIVILLAFYIGDLTGAIVHIDQMLMWASALAASIAFNAGKEIVLKLLG